MSGYRYINVCFALRQRWGAWTEDPYEARGAEGGARAAWRGAGRRPGLGREGGRRRPGMRRASRACRCRRLGECWEPVSGLERGHRAREGGIRATLMSGTCPCPPLQPVAPLSVLAENHAAQPRSAARLPGLPHRAAHHLRLLPGGVLAWGAGVCSCGIEGDKQQDRMPAAATRFVRLCPFPQPPHAALAWA